MSVNLHMYVQLAVLLTLISLVYGATRYDHWPSILSAAFRWGVNMVFFLGSIFVVMMGIGWWIRN